MARYKLINNGVIDQETGMSIPNNGRNRHWAKYEAWLTDGNAPDPADAPHVPTADEIYDQTIQDHKVLKALVLAINDGSIVPGANVTPAALKTALKAKI